MNGARLLTYLRDQGAVVTYGGSYMDIDAPEGLVSSEIKIELRQYKEEILALLRPAGCIGCGRFAFSNPYVLCYWCRTSAPIAG